MQHGLSNLHATKKAFEFKGALSKVEIVPTGAQPGDIVTILILKGLWRVSAIQVQ
jgi:hypothetical protein